MENRYTISGQVINAAANRGIEGLRVEAWDKALLLSDMVGNSTTDKNGEFKISFSEKFYKEVFWDRKPDMFFKVFYQDRLILSTENTVLWNIDKGTTKVTLTVSIPETGSNGSNGDGREYKVTGKVTGNKAVEDINIVAFDVDLRGAAIFDTAQSLNELEKSEGFELLGKTTTNQFGKYEIPFKTQSFIKSEKGKADVIVYAAREGRIIGRSSLAHLKDYNEKLIENWDIPLDGGTRSFSEYEIIQKETKPLLQGLSWKQIAFSSKTIKFLADESEIDFTKITLFVKAGELAEEINFFDRVVAAELIYGMIRDMKPFSISWNRIASTQISELKQATARSIANNTISYYKEDIIEEFITNLYSFALNQTLEEKPADNRPSPGDILNLVLPDNKDLQSAFLSSYANYNGEPEDFWAQVLPTQPGFADQPDLVRKLQFTNQLSYLTLNHLPLMQEVQNRGYIHVKDMAGNMELNEVVEIIRQTGVPEEIAGSNEEEKIRNYAAVFHGALEAAFPTQAVERMIKNQAITVEEPEIHRSLLTFFNNAEGFDLTTTPVTAYLQDHPDVINQIEEKDREKTINQLKKLQRTIQVSPGSSAMGVLLKNDLTSSYKISRMSKEGFLASYGSQFQDVQIADKVYERANYIQSQNELVFRTIGESINSYSPYVVGDHTSKPKMEETVAKVLPNYTELFGPQDSCKCEHCSSVYSASAYFVEILQFLHNNNLDPSKTKSNPADLSNSALAVLLQRRPDLQYLQLTCENTNTVLPYIDIVNEIMEYYVYHSNLSNYKGHNISPEDKSEDLKASPQHVITEAYKILAGKVSPFNLPYNQPLDVIRAYLDTLKSSRYEVLETGLKGSPDATAVTALSAGYLSMSSEEYQILTGKKWDGSDASLITHLREAYGYTSDHPDAANPAKDWKAFVSEVPEFLKQTGITYEDLTAILTTRYINSTYHAYELIQSLFIDFKKLQDISTTGSLTSSYSDTKDYSVLEEYLSGKGINPEEYKSWASELVTQINKIIVLYSPDSKCNLSVTKIQHADGSVLSGDTNTDDLGRMHRFIRLWKKSGWSINDLDYAITRLGNDISPDFIKQLTYTAKIRKVLSLSPAAIIPFWTVMQTTGKENLYSRVFLNKALQKIDTKFKLNASGSELEDSTVKLGDHIKGLISGLKVSEPEISLIRKDAGLDAETTPLNLENISKIYRYTALAKALGVRIPDFIAIKSIIGIDPFESIPTGPAKTEVFIEKAKKVTSSGFKGFALNYIIHSIPQTGHITDPSEETLIKNAINLREGLLRIENDHFTVPEFTADSLRCRLSLVYDTGIVEKAIAIIENSGIYVALCDKALSPDIPAPYKERVSYNKLTGVVSSKGVLTKNDISVLLAPANDTSFKNALTDIFHQPRIFLTDSFNAFLDVNEANDPNAIKKLVDEPAKDPEGNIKLLVQYKYFISALLPFLRKKLGNRVITQNLAENLKLSPETTAHLIGDVLKNGSALLIEDLSRLKEKGLTGSYFNGALPADNTSSVLTRTDERLDFNWENSGPGSPVNTDNFSVRWDGFISPAITEEYILFLQVAATDEQVKLYIDNIEQTLHTSDNITYFSDPVALKAKTLRTIKVEYHEVSGNAGLGLYWQSASVPKEVVPAETLYPGNVLEEFRKAYIKLYKTSLLLLGLKLDADELIYFTNNKSDYDNLDFNAFTFTHWERLYDYTFLRSSAGDKNKALIDLMAQVKNTPALSAEDFSIRLNAISGWKKNLIQSYTTVYFPVSEFYNEKAYIKAWKVVALCTKLGIDVETLSSWSDPAIEDFDTLNTIAQNVKYTFKARYEDTQWVKAVKPLNDQIRENQKNALIGYLLVQPQLVQWGITDANSLFEYFLIDVQMSACMETSRMVQAIASVQLFIQRCFLNLETEVNPAALSKSRWEWMQDYRVWEANRKVFLYPENWLDPAWRDGKSPFYKELESELLQGDITDENVEDALKSYLFKLDEVARLDVCGVCQEKDSTGNNTRMHVFGRTHSAPYNYYYRTYDNIYSNWSSWEKVPVDINGVDSGNNHGVHLLPVVINKRLYIFWLTFLKKADESKNNDTTITTASTNTQAELTPDFYWEINVGWSEFKQGKWTAKKISREALIPGFRVGVKGENTSTLARYPFVNDLSLFSLYYSEADRKLIVKKEVHGGTFQDAGYFTFSFDYKDLIPGHQLFKVDTNMILQVFEYLALAGLIMNFNYNDNTEERQTDFMGNDRDGKFEQAEAEILNTPSTHNFDLLYPHHDPKVSFFSLNDNFFYKDTERTYFATPKQAYNLNSVLQNGEKAALHPGISKKPIPGYVWEEVRFPVPIGPDPEEYLPIFNNNSILEISEKGKITAVQSYGKQNGQVANVHASPVVEARSLRPEDGFTEMAPNRVSAGTSYAKVDAITKVPGAFEETSMVLKEWLTLSYTATKFYPFFHPHTNQFIKKINWSGLEGFFSVATQSLGGSSEKNSSSDAGTIFNTIYKPHNVNVKKPYPRENVDFNVEGKAAYSQYNWELYFHVPVMIATKLSANQKFEDAMKWFHYIFNPTTNDPDTSVARYWNFIKFKEIATAPAKSLEDFFMSLKANKPNATIAEWRDNPFKPHLVARNMPVHYMKYVVMKYIDNLIAWGDQLFRQNTIEANNKAIQLYILAAHILGPKPKIIPKRGKIKPETYNSLLSKWDAFSNALVELENVFPYSSQITSAASSPVPSGSILGTGHSLYFSIPQNDTLLGYWDTVEDRLYKIRHCLNIEGIFSMPALFAPAIDPGALINALANGGSLSSVLSDLNSPLPYYRFSFMLDKALSMCNDLKSLGAALLSALEKKDAEELSRLRTSHETSVLSMTLLVKEKQIEEAQESFNAILKSRETNAKKFLHYCSLLGIQSPTIPSWDAEAETQLSEVAISVDNTPVDSDESGVKIIPREREDFEKTRIAQTWKSVSAGTEGLASLLHLIPDIAFRATPLGIGTGMNYGGSNFGSAVSGAAKAFDIVSSEVSFEAIRASKFATFIRREEEWTLQANMAAQEIKQIDKQLNAANLRIKIATMEKEQLAAQIEQSKEVELFLQDKYTNLELYDWMKSRISTVYFQTYQLAYDFAKRAEKTYRFERNETVTNFIQFGYWDNLHSGLLSGESLYLALKQMERSYMDTHKRDYEITKNISLRMHDPVALISLKENGTCEVALPEALFDLDYPGHYMRRIKSVSLTIPCITGPYTSINCTLTLLRNKVRISSSKDPQYAESMEGDDDRFITSFITTQSIAASQALNDSGMFELNFRDERYLPFEGAGAVSTWRIELPDKFRQFDYHTISDVIIQLKYTAREGGNVLKEAAVENLSEYMEKAEELSKGEGLYQMFNLKHEFPNEWYKFFNPPSGSGQELLLKNLKSRMPYFSKSPSVTNIEIQSVDLFVKGTDVSINLNEQGLGSSDDLGNLKHYVTGTTVPSLEDDWSLTPASGTIAKEDITDAWIVLRYIINT